MDSREERMRAHFTRAGQGHVFASWPELAPSERATLLAELEAVDLPLIEALGRQAREPSPAQGLHFEPPEVVTLAERASPRTARARARGAELLDRGSVGYVLVAGGQASRLGYEGPKGCFPVAPLSGRTLFELFARKLLAVRARHGKLAPWYVMTSQQNDDVTRAWFAENRWLGLSPDDVFFFRQAMLPALDLEGRILLSERARLFLAPNGHGGVLSALAQSGALEHARARGVERFSYFQVDNPLAPPADPLFLGLHDLAGAQMSSKVVKKRNAHEKVGVIGKVDGKLSCIEYSDLPAERREQRDERGELVFQAGSIALHVIDRVFVERLTQNGLALPWHVARKQMNVYDPSTRTSGTCTGFKFETFVFDALQFAEESVTLEVDRAHEFSPVKNKEGEDSPLTSRIDQCKLHAEWVRASGRALPPLDAHGVAPVEIDPLLADDAATFARRAPAAPRTIDGGHLWE